MSVETVRQEKDEDYQWLAYQQTATPQLGVEIDSYDREQIFSDYKENGVETNDKETAGLHFYDAESQSGKVRIIEGDATHLYYIPSENALNGGNPGDLLEPVNEQLGTTTEEALNLLNGE